MFGVSKQAYYKPGESSFGRIAKEHFIVEYVVGMRKQCPGLGGEKLWYCYQSYFGEQYRIGRDAFLKVLSEHGLLLSRRRRGCRTTDSRHSYPLYCDLVKDLLVDRPFEVWVSDITYIRQGDSFSFLSLITDAYSRQIVGWSLGDSLSSRYPLQALQMAFQSYSKEQLTGLIHHSDRGCQYASYLYSDLLKSRGIRISMSQAGNPKDNAIAERVNGILKREFLQDCCFENIEQLRDKLQTVIEFYNEQRPHRSLDMMTPRQASQKKGKIAKRWKSYKDIYRIPEVGSRE